jgi:hypothetical protein
MRPEQILEALPATSWDGPFDPALHQQAVEALEAGKVLVLALPFTIHLPERRFLDAASLGATRKNISFDPRSGRLGNAAVPPCERPALAALMQRFADAAASLVRGLLPAYAPTLECARTSFRPIEITGRHYTPRHDDRLLHVDAFPSRPLHGRRILRLFSNVAPDGAARAWEVGEQFPAFARCFLPRVRRPFPGSAWALSAFGLTRGRRSAYDEIMLRLHDAAKSDALYQAVCDKAAVRFPPGTTWLCFTDQVLHAAVAGHCALEQTFHLPIEAMMHPERAPLCVLEYLSGQELVRHRHAA